MYQQYIDRITNQPYPQGIKRLADNAYIPFDPANTDYQAYLQWIAEGNEPLPPDAPATE
jgi:hypothetical protein